MDNVADGPVSRPAGTSGSGDHRDALLHRVEALPGAGRYAVAFAFADGSEQAATVTVSDGAVDVADAALPTGWRRPGPTFDALVDAVRAVDAARRASAPTAVLRDVEGGWDVALGNVVLEDSVVRCTAHGPMAGTGDVLRCADCGAAAIVGGP